MANMDFFKPGLDIDEEIQRWKILISDDEEDVHTLTKTVLKNFTYMGKGLEFLSAYSGEETMRLMQEHDDIVLVLLDVIMETDDAGLQVVKRIRDELNNDAVQIVLRTGQAGSAPETEVVMTYAINDYKEKTELSSKKLITTVTTAIRSYENIKAVEKLNYDLEKLLISFDKNVLYLKLDDDEVILDVSDAFSDNFGYSRNELIGQSLEKIIHPSFNDKQKRELEEKLKEHTSYEGEFKYITKDGKDLWATIKRTPEYESNGKFLHYTSILFDITHQKEVESLNHELNRLLGSFDHYVIASRSDEKGNIIYLSEAYCKISGYTKEEVLGKNHNILRHEDTPVWVYKELWDTISNGEIWCGEIRNRKKDGTPYWLDMIILPEYDVKGEFLYYTAISKDITAQKDIQQANIEIEHLNVEIEDTQREILFRLGAVAEARSKETGMHVKRVAEYTKVLALEYGLPAEEAEILKMASPMHDIGKIAIPDYILNKPGKLTPEEFEIMKTHSQLGYEMLKTSEKPILKAAAIIAHQHQEKFDGSGYPQNLAGKNIHIYGRLTALADVFDALGSDRVYKKAWDDDKIFNFFKEQRGVHFDPDLIDIFFDNLEVFLRIRDELKDH